MVHCEDVDGHGGVAVSCLELVHHWPFGGLHQGSEYVRICLDHIGIILCPARFQFKWQSNRISGCWLCSSVLFHGGESRALPHQRVRQDQRVSENQSHTGSLVEALVNILRILVIPLHEFLKLALVILSSSSASVLLMSQSG